MLFYLTVLIVFISISNVFSQTPTNAVNDTGYVGVGTLTPSEKLQVCGNVVVDSSVVVRDSLRVEKDMTIDGSAKIDGDLVVGGNIFAVGTVQAGGLDINGLITFDSLQANLLKTSRIIPLPGDSVIMIGDSSIVINGTTNSIYTSTKGFGDLFIQDHNLNFIPSTWTGNTIINPYLGLLGVGTTTPQAKFDLNGNGLVSGMLSIGTTGFSSKLLIKGIGTTGTTSSLNITNSSNQPLLFVRDDGNIGIGIASPLEKLDVRGTGRFGTTAGYINVGFNTANAVIDNFGTGSLLINYHSHKDVVIGNETVPTPANLKVNGNVGIGTNPNSTYKLEVAGIIRACRVEVEILSGCDFVFENDYALLPLKKRKETVLYNKHLLNVAPAKQMQEKGTDIGETTIGILQNVEEHELYLYNHDERIEKLEKENMELRKMIQELINSKKQ